MMTRSIAGIAGIDEAWERARELNSIRNQFKGARENIESVRNGDIEIFRITDSDIEKAVWAIEHLEEMCDDAAAWLDDRLAELEDEQARISGDFVATREMEMT